MRRRIRTPESSGFSASYQPVLSKSRSLSQSSARSELKAALTEALGAPVRTSSRLTREPSTAWSESMTMLLPAPVSPVRTLRPGPGSISARSMTAMFSMCSSLSISHLA